MSIPTEVETQPLLGALGVALVGVVLEGVLAGRGVRQRLAEVQQPRLAPPLVLWAVIGLLYYATCFGVAYRLLAAELSTPLHRVAFGLLALMVVGNAAWNYTFFRRRDLRLTMGVTVLYAAAAVALAALLLLIDRTAALVMVPYLLYLLYGVWWSCAIWRLNPPPEATRP